MSSLWRRSSYRDVRSFSPPGDLVETTACVLEDVARAAGGRTLGLFTSLRRMREVHDRLSEALRGEGYEVLMPRRATDDPAGLVERFRRTREGDRPREGDHHAR